MECLIKGCADKVYTRGLCNSHYNIARRRIKQKRTTWIELEGFRVALPKKKTGRKGTRTTEFDSFLEDVRNGTHDQN